MVNFERSLFTVNGCDVALSRSFLTDLTVPQNARRFYFKWIKDGLSVPGFPINSITNSAQGYYLKLNLCWFNGKARSGCLLLG